MVFCWGEIEPTPLNSRVVRNFWAIVPKRRTTMPTGMIGKLPVSAVRGPVDALYDNLASANGQRVLEELKKFNKQQPCWLPQEKAAKPNITPKPLIFDRYYAAVVLKERHDPAAFYQTREGLYVGNDFQTNIVAAAKPTEAGKKFKKMSGFKLARPATGNDLMAERPQSIWTATDFCPWLAEKLSKQPRGEAGEIANDNWTISLVTGVNGAVFVVIVRWYSASREWVVNAWLLGRRLEAGDQFVSRNWPIDFLTLWPRCYTGVFFLIKSLMKSLVMRRLRLPRGGFGKYARCIFPK